MPEENEQTSRVAMLWPEDLKTQVRERVGARGLTKFTLEAVAAKLGNHDAHQADSAELEDVRFLAQQLADLAVRGGEHTERYEQLQEIELPDWIDTTGWPEDMAALVPQDPDVEVAESSVGLRPTNDPTTYEDDGVDISDQLQEVERDEEPASTAPPRAAADLDSPTSDGLLARIRHKAAEKGVDLTGLDLKPASTITVTEPQPEPEPEPSEPEPAGAATPDACPNCGSPLVAGECWECF